MIRSIFVVLLLFLSSCASVQVNGEARVRLSTVSQVLKNCPSLVGERVVIEGVYRGWSCPEGCRNPGVTRSDACIVDSTGCIYISGTGGLSPVMDRGKLVRVEGVVSKKGEICYLKPERLDVLR